MLNFKQVAAIFLAALTGLAHSREIGPDELVRRTTMDVLNIIKNDKDLAAGDTRKIVQLAEEKVLPNFNFERMTQLAVGRAWRDASEVQRESLIREFRTLLVRTYSTSLTQFRNQAIDVKPSKMAPGDKDTVIKTQISQPGGQPIPIDYSMEKTDKGWKAYDIVVDGVSLVTNYRSTFAEEVRKSGIDGLIKVLSDRNAKSAQGNAKK